MGGEHVPSTISLEPPPAGVPQLEEIPLLEEMKIPNSEKIPKLKEMAISSSEDILRLGDMVISVSEEIDSSLPSILLSVPRF